MPLFTVQHLRGGTVGSVPVLLNAAHIVSAIPSNDDPNILVVDVVGNQRFLILAKFDTFVQIAQRAEAGR